MQSTSAEGNLRAARAGESSLTNTVPALARSAREATLMVRGLQASDLTVASRAALRELLDDLELMLRVTTSPSG